MFIVVDGPDGSGKSTVMDFLATHFTVKNIPHEISREPGGSYLAEALRQIWVDPQYEISGTTELLLMSAMRSDHIERRIRPALAEGKFVLCSRYIASTYALQVASGAELTDVDQVVEVSTRGFLPDLTIILDVPVETTVERVGTREFVDRIERKGLAYHQLVRENFLQYAQDNPEHCVVVDGTQTREAVQQNILRVLESAILDRKEYLLSAEDFDHFEQQIEEGPTAEAALALMDKKKRWE